MELRRLFPEPANCVEVSELVAGAIASAKAPADRPHVFVNFVESADGHATVDGRSRGLGDEADHAIFHGLREGVDAVMAGTGTLRIERYGRILSRLERRERRSLRGDSLEPLAVVITRSGDVPDDIPLFDEPEARIIIFSPADVPLEPSCRAQITVVRLEAGEATLTTALRRLRSDFGVRTLLCEGGPTLFGALLHEGLVDELFLTLAPKLVGGGHGPAVTSGPELPEPRSLRPIWLLEHESSLYLRYAVGA
jgi:5-amino-6-(5-phosphoribosylamino)uracil reductase